MQTSYTMLEICFLLISTMPMPIFLIPMTVSFMLYVKNSDSHPSGLNFVLAFLFKAFVLRCSLVVATLLHEASHLIAAATTYNQPFKSVFSRKNLMGGVEFDVWLRALCPIVQWPNAACSAHVELPFSPSVDAHRWVRCAGPSASLILAVTCSVFAWLDGCPNNLITIATGTWMIAIGGIASDILTEAENIRIFRCGNFGMLVICMMDRYVSRISHSLLLHGLSLTPYLVEF
jgi:hypothetical protein